MRVSTKTGLSDSILGDLQGVFERFPEVEEVWLYGSRARSDHGPGSDIDLAVVAPGMAPARFAALFADLEALPLAFPMDILHWERLENPQLKRDILADRRVLYSRVTEAARKQKG